MIFSTKNEVRDYAKSYMLSLTKTRTTKKEIALLSSKLLIRFIEDSNNIFIYKSNKGEVPTRNLIKNLLRTNKNIFLPKITKPGIMSPINIMSEEIIEPNKIDLVIAPCLSMDKHGNRIGYGGGYYDRFLKDYKRRVIVLVHRELFLTKFQHLNMM